MPSVPPGDSRLRHAERSAWIAYTYHSSGGTGGTVITFALSNGTAHTQGIPVRHPGAANTVADGHRGSDGHATSADAHIYACPIVNGDVQTNRHPKGDRHIHSHHTSY